MRKYDGDATVAASALEYAAACPRLSGAPSSFVADADGLRADAANDDEDVDDDGDEAPVGAARSADTRLDDFDCDGAAVASDGVEAEALSERSPLVDDDDDDSQRSEADDDE